MAAKVGDELFEVHGYALRFDPRTMKLPIQTAVKIALTPVEPRFSY
jgi:hypothetical protein